jgi:hypothetical protein
LEQIGSEVLPLSTFTCTSRASLHCKIHRIIFYDIRRTKKIIFWDDLLEIVRRGNAESITAMSSKYYFRPCITHYFLVACNENTGIFFLFRCQSDVWSTIILKKCGLFKISLTTMSVATFVDCVERYSLLNKIADEIVIFVLSAQHVSCWRMRTSF